MTAVLDTATAAVVFRAARQDKPWGHEVIFAAGEAGYVGKVIDVTAGHALSLQHHEHNATKAGSLYQDLPMLPGTTMRAPQAPWPRRRGHDARDGRRPERHAHP